MNILKMMHLGVKGCWFSLWGRVFAFFYYDKKYLGGKWFRGRLRGLCSPGWEWTAKNGFARFIFGVHSGIRFPVSPLIKIVSPENIDFHPDDLNNFQTVGNYFQAIGKITIGHGTYIAPNVGLITSNHDLDNLDNHLEPKPIVLGEKCWIGMNAVILPGVVLGDGTVVGAGAVVTKSFTEGHCVIAGNPAKKIRDLS